MTWGLSIMKHGKPAFIALLLLLLGGCAVGVNFTKPSDSQLVVGVSRQADVLASLGKPNFTTTLIVNGKSLPSDTYAYAVGGSGDGALPGVTPARSLSVTFNDGVLVQRVYSSSFKEDSTLFDVDKAKTVKPGMTTDEVTGMLGKPSGAAVYPATSAPGIHALIYLFTETKGFKSEKNELTVEADGSGHVTKSNYSQIGQL